MQIPAISKEMINEVLARVSKEDTVKSKWEVSTDRVGIAWRDANCLSVRCSLRTDGHVVEDCA